jgi:alpha-galactosidase
MSKIDLKYDNCNVPSSWSDEYTACVAESDYTGVNPGGTCPGLEDPAPADYDWKKSNTTKRYDIMRDALLAVQHEQVIFYSLCEWGQADVVSWGNGTGNSWRMSNDINGKMKPGPLSGITTI